MTEPNHEITERILDVLEAVRISDITQVAKMAGTTRITAKKHLERLTREKTLKEYRIGRARIFLVIGGGEK
jgi:predicted ArsR family transcriptional regulator